MKKKFLLFLLIMMSFLGNLTNPSLADTYNWTDHPMEVGVADANPDVVDECLMHLKYDNAGGVSKLNPLGSTSSSITLPANEITTAGFTGTPTVTLPAVTDTTKQTTSILDFTTASASYPTLSTTGTLRWSDRNQGRAPSAYSTVSGVRNRLNFSTIDAGANWEAEYTSYGGVETVWTRPNLTANGTLGTGEFSVYSAQQQGSYPVWYAFDGVTNNNPLAADFTSAPTIVMWSAKAIKVASFSIKNRMDIGYGWTAGNVYASNNNTDYTLLTSFTNSNTTAGAIWDINIPLANRNFYNYYKIIVTSYSGGSTVVEITIAATYIAQ